MKASRDLDNKDDENTTNDIDDVSNILSEQLGVLISIDKTNKKSTLLSAKYWETIVVHNNLESERALSYNMIKDYLYADDFSKRYVTRVETVDFLFPMEIMYDRDANSLHLFIVDSILDEIDSSTTKLNSWCFVRNYYDPHILKVEADIIKTISKTPSKSDVLAKYRRELKLYLSARAFI
jgi:hypothetical protein